MTQLLCLLIGVALTLVALGLMVRRGARPVAAAAAYRNAAWRLNLEADTRGTSLRGDLEGRRLFIGSVAPKGQVGALEIDPPLGIGLRIRPRAMGDRIRRRHTPVTGDPELDDQLDVRASHADPVRPLFTDDVCRALEHLQETWRDFEVKDDVVRVFLRQPVTREAKVQDLIDTLRRTADALSAARRTLPVSPDLQDLVGQWRVIAEARQWELDPCMPALRGPMDGRTTQVCVVRGRDGVLTCRIRVHLASHRALGLSLSPQQQQGATEAPVGQDIQMGDNRFDDAFLIRGYDPHAVRAALNDAARAALLELASEGRVLLTDRRLEIDTIPPESVERTLAEAQSVVTALGW